MILIIDDDIAIRTSLSLLLKKEGFDASAVGTPVVAIFGPTVPAFGYTPYGAANRIVEHANMPCRPCDRHGPQVCPLGHHRCMTEIPAGRVLAELAGVLRRPAG